MCNVKAKLRPVGITATDRNHIKIIYKIPEQHSGKARNQGTTKTAILGPAHTLQKVLT